MTALNWIAAALMAIGAFFFLAGTLGLLRFPDSLSRLHALTKADTVGLGFVSAGLALEAGSWLVAMKLLLIWLLALLAGATACYLYAEKAVSGPGFRVPRAALPETGSPEPDRGA